MNKKLLILIAAHLIGLGGIKYLHSSDFQWFQEPSSGKSESLGERRWAVVRVPVANLNESNRFSASVVTQALMGMPIRLLQKNRWYQVELPDGYRGWIHGEQIQPMTTEELARWNACDKLVVTALSARALALGNDSVVATLTSGAHVALVRRQGSDVIVELPDGRQARMFNNETMPLKEFQQEQKRKRLEPDFGRHLVKAAEGLLGQSYQWGGTSVQGMDCSGLIKTVYWMFDMILPRDAGQQAYIGERFYSKQEAGPGDLYFFGSVGKDHRARVSHVAMATGRERFIHALGDVHRSSLNPSDPDFDAYEKRRYLWSVRLDWQRQSDCWQSSAENGFYRSPPEERRACDFSP